MILLFTLHLSIKLDNWNFSVVLRIVILCYYEKFCDIPIILQISVCSAPNSKKYGNCGLNHWNKCEILKLFIIGSFLSDDRNDIWYTINYLNNEIFEFQTILISDYAIDSIKLKNQLMALVTNQNQNKKDIFMDLYLVTRCDARRWVKFSGHFLILCILASFLK